MMPLSYSPAASKKQSISSIDCPKNLILKSTFNGCQTGLPFTSGSSSSHASPSACAINQLSAKNQPVSNSGLATRLDPDVNFRYMSALAALARSGSSGFFRQPPLVPSGPLAACRTSAELNLRAGALAWEHQKHQHSKLYSETAVQRNSCTETLNVTLTTHTR